LERKQPARSNWLQDEGLGEDNLYYLCCSICSTKVAACRFQSRAQNIKTHEASQLHQRAALKWQEIQDRRGVLQDFQAAAAQLTAQLEKQLTSSCTRSFPVCSRRRRTCTTPLPCPLCPGREATRLGAQLHFGAWVKLAELVMVMVPGSVEDERMFSTLKYICNPQRNKLQVQYLTCCARGFRSSAFSV